jgi:diguanylate cyclase (GGDEF)-like protein
MVLARSFTQLIFSAGILATTAWPITPPRLLWAGALAAQMLGFLAFGMAFERDEIGWMISSGTMTSIGIGLQMLALQKFQQIETPVWVILFPLASCVLALCAIDAGSGLVTALLQVVQAIQFAWLAETVVGLRKPFARIGARSLLIAGCMLAIASAIGGALDGLIGLHPIPMAEITLIIGSLGFILVNMGWLAAQKDHAEFKLERLAQTDPLTGILNRRGFAEESARLLAQAASGRRPVVLLLIDIDHFKTINDRWGHDVGDRVLVTIGEALSATCRARDRCVRSGGEEFGLLFFDADISLALGASDHLKQRLALSLRLPDGQPIRFSGGITAVGPQETDLKAAFARADSALYQAKMLGRDRVVQDEAKVLVIG